MTASTICRVWNNVLPMIALAIVIFSELCSLWTVYIALHRILWELMADLFLNRKFSQGNELLVDLWERAMYCRYYWTNQVPLYSHMTLPNVNEISQDFVMPCNAISTMSPKHWLHSNIALSQLKEVYITSAVSFTSTTSL